MNFSSEYNASQTEPVHFLQIWIIPDQTSLKPGYEQQAISFDKNRGRWELLASRAGRDASLTVHQDVDLWATRLAPGERATFGLRPSRHAFAQVTRGAVTLNGVALGAGDGAAATQEEILEFKAVDGAETLLFDLVSYGCLKSRNGRENGIKNCSSALTSAIKLELDIL